MRVTTVFWVLFAFAQVQSAQAQPPEPPANVVPQPVRVLPAMVPANGALRGSRAPTLADLVLAKVVMGEDGPRVILMVESYRTETTTAQVTVIRQEERSREVLVDGKTVTQDYTVNVPHTILQEIQRKIPAGRKPRTMQGDAIRFFNLDGEPVSIDGLAKTWTTLRPIFLIDQSKSDPQPISGIAKQAIHENCLIAVTEKQIRPAPNVHWAAPPIPAIQLRKALKP